MKTTIKTTAAEQDTSKFNPKHEIFIKEMATHGNKVRAYRAAYPTTAKESARAAASRLLANKSGWRYWTKPINPQKLKAILPKNSSR